MKTSFLLLAALLLPAELALSQHAGRALGRRARSFNSRGIRSLAAHPSPRHHSPTSGHKPRHARQSSRYIAQEHESQQPEVQQQKQTFEELDEQQPEVQQQMQQEPETQQPMQQHMEDLDLFQKPMEQVTQSPFQYGGYSDTPTTIAPLLQQQQISTNDAPMSEEEELAQMQQNSINQDELFAPRAGSGSPHYADYSGNGNRKSNYGGNGKHYGGSNGNKKNGNGYSSNDYNSGLGTGSLGTGGSGFGTGGSGTAGGSASGGEDDVFGNMDGMSGSGDPMDMMRAAIKGEPGKDYPILSEVPSGLAFKCSQQQFPGYYGDVEARCQVFHICQEDGRHNAFLCPNGTIFSQRHFVCVWWHEFECDQTESLYSLNSELYKTGSGSGSGHNGGNELGTGSSGRGGSSGNGYSGGDHMGTGGYDGSNTYSGNGEFASNYAGNGNGENNYGGSGDDFRNELFGQDGSSKATGGTNGDYSPGQQKMNDYSGTKGGSKPDYSGMKTAQKPMNDYSGMKTAQKPMNDYSGMKTAQKPMNDYSGMKTAQKPMNDYSGMKTAQQPMNDYSGTKNAPKPDYSGMKTAQKPMNDYSGMKTAQKPMNDYSGTKNAPKPDYSGMKTAQQPMNDYSGMKTAQQPMNDYSGMKTAQQPMNDYSGSKNAPKTPDYSGMKSPAPPAKNDYSGKSGRMSSPRENLNRMYVQQIDEFTTMSPMSYSGKTNNASPNYSGTKGLPKRPQPMFEPQQQQELMNYDEPQAPVTDATPMMFTPPQPQEHHNTMEDVFEETSTPDSLEAALGEEIHSEAPLIESMALTSSPMRVSTPVPNNYSPYGGSKSQPTSGPSKTASPMKNFYAAQEQQKLQDDAAFEKPNYGGYSGTKSPKPPKKGVQSSSSPAPSNELKSPMMMMRNGYGSQGKGYGPSSSPSPLKSPSAMMNKSYSPSPASYGTKQRK